MKKMQRKHRWTITVAAVACVAIGLGAVALLDNRATSDDSRLRTELGCGRVTSDYRETDVLCGNLTLYRNLLKRGIAPGDSSSGPIVKLALVRAEATASPVANAPVELSVRQVSPCLVAPCPYTSHIIWSGTADDLGIVQVPRDKMSADAIIIVASGELSGSLHNALPTKAAYIVPMHLAQ